jgi:nucleotide-binding universal stress UspA family protein
MLPTKDATRTALQPAGTTAADDVSTTALLVRSPDTDDRARSVADAMASRLGISVSEVSAHSPPAPGPDALLCISVGLHVADDVADALVDPGCSVLVVGPHCSTRLTLDGPVIVPFDGSHRSAAVFSTARELADRLDVPIVLTHMWAASDARNHGSEIFERVRAALAALGPSTRFEPVGTSYPAGAIRELAHELDASLVAMSTLSADAGVERAIGHVAERVVRDCSCPVLLTRPKDGDAPAAPPFD